MPCVRVSPRVLLTECAQAPGLESFRRQRQQGKPERATMVEVDNETTFMYATMCYPPIDYH